ncbi:MAG: bile acid:sodium symporter [Spirochaetaceae bacterium]|jgi:ACR3 family arsenite efflux pump ArsB|nr:bile acid:sodium symporter [Spirochaetaceae bacterium]
MLAAAAGIVTGKANPFIAQHSGKFTGLFLMTMLFFVFLTINIKEITKSFYNVRFSLSALIINFVWTPLFALLLSKIFMAGHSDLQTGFIMLMVTPCTDWYLIFTGLANGSTVLGSSILPLNLVLQIVLLPVYLFLFMGKIISFDGTIIIKSIVFVLIIPLVSANLIKIMFNKISLKHILETILTKSDDIQFLLLCLAIISMFASQGALLLEHLEIFLNVFPPLMLFFIFNFALAFFTGKKLRLPASGIIPLIFTTSARNSPVALAIAAITFPLQPVISLVLVIGPLIELPVLAVNSILLKKWNAGTLAKGPRGNAD